MKPRQHHNKRAALYNITDKGLSTREERVTRMLQQACDSVASRIEEVGQGHPIQIDNLKLSAGFGIDNQSLAVCLSSSSSDCD